jgi:hypothetical protein
MSKREMRAKAMVLPLPVEHQVVLTDYPDGMMMTQPIDELDEAVIDTLKDGNHYAGPPNIRAGTYSKSANTDAALRFGIHFTTEQYHVTKLLEISLMPIPCIISTKR